MCGIAGIIGRTIINPSELISMSDSLRHRGPDDEGFLLLNSSNKSIIQCKGKDTVDSLGELRSLDLKSTSGSNVGFVHRRLSIIDLSSTGHQPMSDESGNLWIIYNGEIYNYLELKDELKYSYRFRTNSDTEVILAAYHKWGTACMSHFIGMWAFAILDLRKRSVILSRDRYGIKPLYISINNRRIVFASEIKALLVSKLIEPKADIENLTKYIAYGNIMDRTLFKGVSSVKAGSVLHIDLDNLGLKEETYYSLGKNNIIPYDNNEKEVQNYFELLSESVKLHLRSDVQVGSCLSGGIDSSVIISLAAPQIKTDSFKTFTAVYPGHKIDESKYARLATKNHPNIDQIFCYPDPDGFLNDLEKIVYHNDFPVNSTSVYAQWEVMKTVQSHRIKVLLDGQGADEVLGGYYPFAGIYMIEEILKIKLLSFLRNYKNIKQNFTKDINQVIGRALFYFLPQVLQKRIRTQRRLGPNLLSGEYKRLFHSLDVPEIGGKDYYEYSLNSIRYGLTELLRYEDRNSMAFSIESRVPFLDHRLVDFTLSLDKEYKLHKGWTKYILRRASENILPGEISYRKDKIGFATPQSEWKSDYKTHLYDYINQTYIPEILDKESVLSLCNTELKNPTKNSEFWKIISLIKWFEVFYVSLV